VLFRSEGLEKLWAQAKANFIREQEKLEQKELDEMAAIGFVRKTDPVLRQIAQTGDDQ
jgi:flagellar biosynthesis chaperone FliJ